MSEALTVTLAVLVPPAGALLIGLARRRPNLRESVTVATSVLLFVLVASLVEPVQAGATPRATWFTVLPGVDLAFAVEPLGMLFALIASFLWIPTAFYAFGYMRAHEERNQTRFYACFAVALGATVGVAFAANLVTLFLFYEILTLSTFPLVTHSGSDEARRAGRTYLGLLLGTSIALQLLAILWTWTLSDTLDFATGGILAGRASDATLAVLLALYLFGIGKAALMPFHRWLPAAMVAPTPVSALLHAVAVVKAGTFGCVRLVHYVFGVDLLRAMGADTILAVAAALTILLASVRALGEQNLKRRLAYSTVSQLSYIVLGAAIGSTAAVAGAMFHIVAHGFMKITLFFCAGAIYIKTHKLEIPDLAGLGRQMPITFGAFTLGALGLAGTPLCVGFISKWNLGTGALQSGQPVFLAVFVASGILNFAYFFPVVYTAFFGRPGQAVRFDEANAALWAPLAATAIVSLILGIYPNAGLQFYHLAWTAAESVMAGAGQALAGGGTP